MPLISDDKLPEVARELSRRGAKLYHACQLADVRSYLQLGGVPSRNLLMERRLPYTAFDTDRRDSENRVWRLVFFNLSDFGYWFAQGKNNMPNPFGPILLCFDPRVICQADNISITLRSAGGMNFDRIAEGLDANDVARLFTDADSPRVRFAECLQEEFRRPEARSPEMSCSFVEELAPLSHLVHIRVDPYVFPEGSLTDIVYQIVRAQGTSIRVSERCGTDGYKVRYRVLLDAILSGVRKAPELRNTIPDGPPMSSWRDAVLRSAHLSFQFERYARYLAEGTLN